MFASNEISVLILIFVLALTRAQFFDDDDFDDDNMVITSEKCSQDEFDSWLDDIERAV